MKISVVINTYNAEEFLERVLQSVQSFDEILICDMYSEDKTIAIAQRYNCRIIYHERTGVVEPARAFAIKAALHDWVLVVDADECVPLSLRDFLYEQIKQSDCPAGIRIPRKNYFMGRFLHSAYPDHILRFFKKELVNWSPVIHTSPQVDGCVYTIPGKQKEMAFIHLGNELIETLMEKMNRYTNFELERRQNRNYGYFALIFHPFVRFFRFYIAKGGFRDGKPGFIWAYLSAYYKFITITKVIESKVKKEDMDADLKS